MSEINQNINLQNYNAHINHLINIYRENFNINIFNQVINNMNANNLSFWEIISEYETLYVLQLTQTDTQNSSSE